MTEGAARSMVSRYRRWRLSGRDEAGAVETFTFIIAIPVLLILALGLISIALMFSARNEVAAVVRDAARSAAADGGNMNPRVNTSGVAWDARAEQTLTELCAKNGCTSGPSVNCRTITTPSGQVYASNTAAHSGDIITCVATFPYRGINKGLLDSPLGLGIGRFLKSFTIETAARAETGTLG